MSEEIKNKIKELTDTVLMHDRLYAKDAPIISDSAYDDLYLELVKLEEENPEYALDYTPTKRIIPEEVEGLEAVKHDEPILSQKKMKTSGDVIKFIKSVTINGVKYIIVQHKLDGLTIILYYKNGKLTKAVTRGNGAIGYDVTHAVLNIDSIPKELKEKKGLKVRGEGIILESDFEEINEKLIKEGKEPFKTARNLASGTMKNLDGTVARDRKVQFIAFDIMSSSDEFESDIDRLENLKYNGFNVVQTEIFKIDEVDKLMHYIESFDKSVRPTLDYTVDGLVLKIDSLEARKVLGNREKSPRWAGAYKFESLNATTKIIDVKESVGRTGIVTPVAILEPVYIAGVLVTKASLANKDNIKERDIRLFDTVLVQRAGDVIPQVMYPMKELRTGIEKEIEIATTCPCCESETYIDGAFIKCSNMQCPARIENKIKHFVSRDALNIDSFGEKAIALFMEKGFINSIIDIYNLKNIQEDIKSLRGYGDKKLNKILKNIEASKESPLSNVLYGLGINNVGLKKAKVLANHFESMDNILESMKKGNIYSILCSLEDFGDIVSNDVIDFFSDEENLTLIENLRNHGFAFEEKKSNLSSEDNPYHDLLAGKTFVVTGSFSVKRDDLKNRIESLGGKVVNAVSKSTSYLLLGTSSKDKASSKHTQAIENNVPILNEEGFEELLNDLKIK